MAAENQKLSDEKGESLMNEKESAGDAPRTGWFRFRLRTYVLLLLGVALLGWFVPLLIIQSMDDSSDFDKTVMQLALALLALGFVSYYAHRFSRCPNCGKYELRKEKKNLFIDLLEMMFAGEQNYWEICRNCGYAERREGSTD